MDILLIKLLIKIGLYSSLILSKTQLNSFNKKAKETQPNEVFTHNNYVLRPNEKPLESLNDKP